MTRNEARSAADVRPAGFAASERVVVVADDGTLCEPGDGRIGMLGVGGPIPIGYYKDPEKTAATFRSVGGRHYSIPGDYARIEADGIVTLLGRGSACINTGGEKVYPEEVELVLRSHPTVLDCVVVGVPDERWGEMVVALVEPSDGDDFDEAAVAAHCRARIAAYKCPKRFVALDSLERSPAGKADYALPASASRPTAVQSHRTRDRRWRTQAFPRSRAEEGRALVDAGALLLDVRELDEWQAGHAPDARVHPARRARRRASASSRATGASSRSAARARARRGRRGSSAAQGFDVVNLAGGMRAWAAAGLDVVTDDGAAGTVI